LIFIIICFIIHINMISKSQKKHSYKLNTKLLLLICLFFFITIFFYLNKINFRDRIYPNIYIDGEPIGGLFQSLSYQQLIKKERYLSKTTITFIYQNAPMATLSGQQINIHRNIKNLISESYKIGRHPNLFIRIYQQLITLMKLKKYSFISKIEYNVKPLQELIDIAQQRYEYPSINALFKFKDGRVINFSPEKNGLQIDKIRFWREIEKIISNLKQDELNQVVVLHTIVIQPEITLKQINKFGIRELIAEGKSNYTHSIPERIYNLSLAAYKFDGVLIPTNKIFSFNDTVGDISSLTGYKPAYIIKQGKTVLGDGGGVCQVSTTLFRAALNAGLPINERHAHAYRVSYYENDGQPGFDATVFAPTVDLKFTNNTPAYILIQVENDKNNNLLTFKFYGQKDDRHVIISPVSIYNIQPPLPSENQNDPILKKGIVKQIDFPAWGAKTVFNYQVVAKKDISQNVKFYSNYQPWRAVFLVGQAD